MTILTRSTSTSVPHQGVDSIPRRSECQDAKAQVVKFLRGSVPQLQSGPHPFLQGIPLPQDMAESASITCEAFGVNDDPLHWVRLLCLWVTVRLQVHVDLQGTVCQRPGPQPGGQTVRGCWIPTTQPTLTSSMMD